MNFVCRRLNIEAFRAKTSLMLLVNRVFHLRTTILAAEEDMHGIMASLKKFNDEFMEQYEDTTEAILGLNE